MASPDQTDNQKPIDKAGAWHRLNREDRLDAFNARREQIRSELKAKGAKRKQAAHEAWRLALDEFPPLPVVETPADDPCVDEDDDAVEWWQKYPEELLPPPPPYNGSDTLWVFHHMVLRSTREEDAPSRGAWGLLQWARANRNAFFTMLLSKAIAAQEKKSQEEEVPAKSEPKSGKKRHGGLLARSRIR